MDTTRPNMSCKTPRFFRYRRGMTLIQLLLLLSALAAAGALGALIWGKCGPSATPPTAIAPTGAWFSFTITPTLVGNTAARFTVAVVGAGPGGPPMGGVSVQFRVTGDAQAAPSTNLVVTTGANGAAYVDVIAKHRDVVGAVTNGKVTVTATAMIGGQTQRIEKQAPVNNTVSSR